MEKAIIIRDPRTADIHSFDRVYIGNEFCQNLLASRTELMQQVSYVKGYGKNISFVTPYLTDTNRLRALLDSLENNCIDAELIVNDFGVLDISKEYGLKIVLGRVLANHIMKDDLELSDNSSYTSNIFRKLGVRRVEISNKGPEMKINCSFPVSLYYPYFYISTSRRCMHGFPRRFLKQGFAMRECRTQCGNWEIKNRKMDEKIRIIGNTNFICRNNLPIKENIPSVDRLVFMPDNFFY